MADKKSPRHKVLWAVFHNDGTYSRTETTRAMARLCVGVFGPCEGGTIVPYVPRRKNRSGK